MCLWIIAEPHARVSLAVLGGTCGYGVPSVLKSPADTTQLEPPRVAGTGKVVAANAILLPFPVRPAVTRSMTFG